MIRKPFLTSLLLLLTDFCISNDVLFEKKTAMSARILSSSSDLHFKKVSGSHFWVLCQEAKAHMSVIYYNYYGYKFPVFLYEFEYPERNEVQVAVACHTLPVIYIGSGDSETNMDLILVEPPSEQYEFDQENVWANSITLAHPKDAAGAGYANNALTSLNHEQRRRLCVAAHKYFPFKFEHNYVMKALVYTVQYPQEVKTAVAIDCPTLPPVYIRLGDWHNKMTLIHLEVYANQYTFNVEIVISKKGYVVEQSKKDIQNSVLSTLSTRNRWYLCEAARSHLRYDLEQFNFVFQPEVYEFVYPNGTVQKHVAISCYVSPPTSMYLRVGKTQNEFIVVLEKDEVARMEIKMHRLTFYDQKENETENILD